MEISNFDEDLIGLQEFADRLEIFIDTESKYVNDSLVLCLDGKFGSGKSTFLKMWENKILNAENNDDNKLIVNISAWEDDYCGDPLFSIISALLDGLEKINKDTEKLQKIAKDTGWFLLSIGNQVVSKVSGVNFTETNETVKAKKEEQSILSPFEVFVKRKEALQEIKNTIKEIINENNLNLLIFVDDLDRCRPDYAISYLETIKHIFDISGITFILATDLKQLENSAKIAFGHKLNFQEYIRKFIHRQVSLPAPDDRAYGKIATKYVKYYLQDGERYSLLKLDEDQIQCIIELISSFKMTPRQIQEIFRIVGHIFETDENKKGSFNCLVGVGTILMSILRVSHHKSYEKLANKDLEIKEAAELFRIRDEHRSEWWFTFCLSGHGLKDNGKSYEEIFRDAGYINTAESYDFNQMFIRWNGMWGISDDNQFAKIYSKIENVLKWS